MLLRPGASRATYAIQLILLCLMPSLCPDIPRDQERYTQNTRYFTTADMSHHCLPLEGNIVRSYDAPRYRWEPGHRGIDLDASQTIYATASASGVISWSGNINGIPSLSIDHGPHRLAPSGLHLRTTYSPIATELHAGDVVVRGQVIGTVISGHTGCPRTRCLHWGAKYGSGHSAGYINPMLLVYGGRIMLLPTRDE